MARGSLLWGEAEQTVFRQALFVGFATTARDDLLPVAELELGGRWSRDLGGVRLFVQAALSGQGWFGAGNSSNVSNVFTGFDTDNDMNLGFFGLTLATGVEF